MSDIKLTVAMTTADRQPKGPNYLGQTIRALVEQGVPSDRVALFATSPKVKWISKELPGLVLDVRRPTRVLTPNENAVAALRAAQDGWLLFLEDDLSFCKDFLPGVERWIERFARSDRRVYYFSTRYAPIPEQVDSGYWDYEVRRSLGTQAFAIRAHDSLALAKWCEERLPTWRKNMAARWRYSGIDELIKKWAVAAFPDLPFFGASFPAFVQHIGDVSLTHAPRKPWRNATFAGESWSYIEQGGGA